MRLTTLLFLAGCSEYNLSEEKASSEGAAPRIRVDPLVLNFESASLTLPEIQTFAISNLGEGTLDISNMTLGRQHFCAHLH